ncbi:MAG: hypothetical protein ACHQHN_00460 [Sphingobacteriales bacterium]
MKLSKMYYWILPALVVFGMASCKKENSMGYTPGTGAPTVASVKLVNEYVTGIQVQTTSSYSSSGVLSTKSDTNFNYKQLKAVDSTTVTGNLGNMYKISGTNLGSATKLTLNGAIVYFNRSWGDDNSIIFTLPNTIPYVQPQTNNMVITTLHGSVTYKFTTLPPPPTILQLTDFDFWANSLIGLKGKGFASVSDIKLKATGDEVTIVSKDDSTLVLKMPASSAATESALQFTYTSGSNTGAQTVSPTIFNNLDNAYVIYGNSSFQNSWGDNSWQGPSGSQSSNPHAYNGTASIIATYPANGWKIEGWANWYPSFSYDASYTYVSFWVKGGKTTETLALVGDQMNPAGNGYSQNTTPSAAATVVVPPNVWTFFKIPLGTATGQLNYWANGNVAKQLGFFLQGPAADETLYFDEVAFLK